MQRLFSTFPNAWPGCGLLVLRLASAVPLLSMMLGVRGGAAPAMSWTEFAGVAASALLIPGWWTPVGGAVQALAEGYLAFLGGTLDSVHLMRCLMGISLIMLGPGAWSIDARLYGRKRIEVGGRQD